MNQLIKGLLISGFPNFVILSQYNLGDFTLTIIFMRILSSFILAIFLMGIYSNIHAQATKSDPIDIQGRFGADLNLDLPKKWDLGLEYQARVMQNFQTYSGSYLSLGFGKGVSKHLTLLGEYRFARLLDAVSHRLGVGLIADRKIGMWKTDFRVLAMNRVEDFDDVTELQNVDNYLRLRVRGRRKLDDRIELSLHAEPIYRMASGLQIDNYRFQAGFGYDINKHTTLQFYYLNRPDYAKKYFRQYHIFGLGFKYGFKPIKK